MEIYRQAVSPEKVFLQGLLNKYNMKGRNLHNAFAFE
jgi:hypothetical protein